MTEITRFYAGDRVKVSDQYSWAKSATGVIKPNPRPGIYNMNWNGCPRTDFSPDGPLFFYWVEFDSPQKLAHGQDYSNASEIESRFLIKIASGA